MAGRFGPNVMASLALLVLGLCAWVVLVSNALLLGPPSNPFAVDASIGTRHAAQLTGVHCCSWVELQGCSTMAMLLHLC